MNEFAPEYSTREKVILLVKHMAWVIPIFVVTKIYFFPWFERYLENAHCYTYGDVTGIDIIFYGLFVGFPLATAIFLFLFEGLKQIEIIRLGQSPLPGQRVLRPTRYTYGVRAKLKPYFFFLFLIFLLGLALNGIFSANQVIGEINQNGLRKCSAGINTAS